MTSELSHNRYLGHAVRLDEIRTRQVPCKQKPSASPLVEQILSHTPALPISEARVRSLVSPLYESK